MTPNGAGEQGSGGSAAPSGQRLRSLDRRRLGGPRDGGRARAIELSAVRAPSPTRWRCASAPAPCCSQPPARPPRAGLPVAIGSIRRTSEGNPEKRTLDRRIGTRRAHPAIERANFRVVRRSRPQPGRELRPRPVGPRRVPRPERALRPERAAPPMSPDRSMQQGGTPRGCRPAGGPAQVRQFWARSGCMTRATCSRWEKSSASGWAWRSAGAKPWSPKSVNRLSCTLSRRS